MKNIEDKRAEIGLWKHIHSHPHVQHPPSCELWLFNKENP
jgi:hypothetical protein